MRKYPNVLVLLLVLSIALTSPTAAVKRPHSVDASDGVRRLVWQDTEENAPRCREVAFAEAGLWWIELWTAQPSTAPGLVVVHTGLEAGPRFVERIEGLLLRVDHPGEHLVCLTSQASLGVVELASALVARADEMSTKDGDPDETEVELDP